MILAHDEDYKKKKREREREREREERRSERERRKREERIDGGMHRKKSEINQDVMILTQKMTHILLSRFYKEAAQQKIKIKKNNLRAWIDPRRREDAVLIESFVMELSPIDRFVRGFEWLTQIIRRLVQTRNPRSPLFPFESSTELIESISNSPRRGRRSETGASNRSARSCHVGLYA